MDLYHVIFLTTSNHMVLAQTFTRYAEALNYIHGKERPHPIDAYVIVTGKSVPR